MGFSSSRFCTNRRVSPPPLRWLSSPVSLGIPPCAPPSFLDSFSCNYHTPGSTFFLLDRPASPYKPEQHAVQYHSEEPRAPFHLSDQCEQPFGSPAAISWYQHQRSPVPICIVRLSTVWAVRHVEQLVQKLKKSVNLFAVKSALTERTVWIHRMYAGFSWSRFHLRALVHEFQSIVIIK